MERSKSCITPRSTVGYKAALAGNDVGTLRSLQASKQKNIRACKLTCLELAQRQEAIIKNSLSWRKCPALTKALLTGVYLDLGVGHMHRNEN